MRIQAAIQKETKIRQDTSGINEWFKENFYKALLDLDLASVPGKTALTRYGTTLGEILGFDGTSLNPERVEIFRLYVTDRLNDLLNGVRAADPLKMFVKQEPHKLAKIAEDRLRLISAVSVVDSMIDRMLFQDIFESVKTHPLATPIAIGWNPLGSGTSVLRGKIKTPTFDTDKKHWDWTFPFWLLGDCYSCVVNLANWPSWRRELAYSRFFMLFQHARFCFPDGDIVEQQLPGIMKSGCYLTLLLNSIGQWFLHDLVQTKLGVEIPFVCFGDDVSQQSSEFDQRFVEEYENFGFTLKSERHEHIEFCGFEMFTMNRFLPAYKEKHIFLLSHLTTDDEIATQTLQSYQYIYWFDKPFLSLIREIALERGLNCAVVPDEQIMRVVYGR